MIDHREQQDAFEFMQRLFDEFPANMHSISKGQILNTIEGIGDSHRSSTFEDFYTFGLQVNNVANVEASLRHLLQSETFQDANQYSR